ncbi:hypothetical protein [Noviherbaspirillum sp. Root189]|uniref:hypothetical protein n=1 Tax=Noviherbaspirillum sp. Root189 TaxID=1736487 RepID=UPI00070D15D6|nr:hypothetical protein [Noviherbaspirillum sp. Root189]KRB70498.1 hypothetical protein ASE07_07755 [Noviherbaspirillum sp. Root189]
MSAKDILIFAGVAVAAYMVLKRRGAASSFATEIPNSALPGQNGYGWRYFSDGTAISPDGTYYLKGKVISSTYDGVSVGSNYGNLTT